MKLVNAPSRWFIRQATNTPLVLWADSYTIQAGGDYVFSSLVDATTEEQNNDELEILARTPTNPQRIDLAVARIPSAAVASISSEPT